MVSAPKTEEAEFVWAVENEGGESEGVKDLWVLVGLEVERRC